MLALILVLVRAVAPTWSQWRQGQRLLAAAGDLATRALLLQAQASASGRTQGLQFDIRDGLRWQQVADGDGDGLRSSDVATGIDRLVGRSIRLAERYPGIAVGLPHGTPGLAGAVPRNGLAFGRAARLSVAPEGTMTAGTLYLQNAFGEAAAVRVYGPTGRVSVWRRRPGDDVWFRLR